MQCGTFSHAVAHICDHVSIDVLAGAEFSLGSYPMRYIFAHCGSHL